MAIFNASIAAGQAFGAAQSLKPQSRDLSGKVRYMMSTITVAAGSAVSDIIVWGTIPKGARVLGGSKIYFSAGAATSTINLGDANNQARFMAATAVTAASSAVAEAHLANGAAAIVPDGAQDIKSVVGGAGLQAGQVITLHLVYVQD